ncbi:MAG: alpha-glucan family phosphorylase [Candidatus Obscuribacterales bacterium]|nr:alpha-glucan family phosphorylase [Candidatus Obscuribacterales bacterium]
MQPIRTVEVSPFLPPELESLRTLAYNLRWTWDHETVNLFKRLDGKLWEASGHNPVLMLGSISQETLNEAAKDESILAQMERISHRSERYLKAESTWYKKQQRPQNELVAYFSAEYGISEALPIYSGGLGILSGDHVKAASDLGLPFVAVGIAYQQGYFRQYLNQEGWQQERYPINDFYNMPMQLVRNANGEPLIVTVQLPGRPVNIQVWKAQVGRVPLYLMDTNIPQKRSEDEDITDALYHADPDVRIKQEIILGVGGTRVLQALGIEATIYHMNEGHSAFLALERISGLMKEHKLSFYEAKELAATGNLFTTHTAVPAGIDKFSPELVDKYFSEYYRALGITRKDFLSLGRANPEDDTELFSMANLAIRLSATTNAVSRLHGDVSCQLFQSNWQEVPEAEVPITHVTNGVHAPSFISDDMAELFDRYLGPRWADDSGDTSVWKKVEDIPDEELWRLRWRRRERLIDFCRKRYRHQLEQKGAMPSELKAAAEILSPEALTIGFARRVATYKRLTLVMRDAKRLASLLERKDRPIQIIMAGKAHPEDIPAKELIRQVIQIARSEGLENRFVFIEDYDMNVARWLVQGVDVWLNTPRRFLEACGTSGMKVVFNGGLNCSILDGWWDEAYNPGCGWAIGRGEVYNDTAYQDELESNTLYDLLEKEISPLFYDRDKDDIPRAWIARMKTSMMEICPQFNIHRMLREYSERMYFPASKRYKEFLSDNVQKARDLASWKYKLNTQWKGVHIESVKAELPQKLCVGDELKVSALIQLGQLSAEDLSVQIYHGPIDAHGNIVDGAVVPMTLSGKAEGAAHLFTGVIRYFRSGRHGFTVRVLPDHADLSSPFETGLIQWGSESKQEKPALSIG